MTTTDELLAANERCDVRTGTVSEVPVQEAATA
jgi:hypothetical protein